MTAVSKTIRPAVLIDGKVPPDHRTTEEEFVAWCDDQTRAEWVDGEVILMPPVSNEHSDVDGWLLGVMRVFVEQKDLGTVRGPELQVRLGKQRRRRVPDVLVVLKNRQAILNPEHVEGAPDLIVEITSPESLARDWREKYLEYEAAGVKEYWIIDPMAQRVELYIHTGKKGYRRVKEKDGVLASAVLPGFHLKTEWLWQHPRPKVLDVLRAMGAL